MQSKPIRVAVIEGSTRRPSSTLEHVNAFLKAQPRPLEVRMHSLLEEKLPLFVDHRASAQWEAHPALERVLDSMLWSETIIIASPVYWYSVSNLIPNFMSHWTYFLRSAKSPGIRFLQNQSLLPIFIGGQHLGLEVNRHFFAPIQLSAKYVGARCLPGFFGLGDREGQANKESLARIARVDLSYWLKAGKPATSAAFDEWFGY